MIFITVGAAARNGFDELIKEIDRIKTEKGLKERIICQIGNGDYKPKKCDSFKFKSSIQSYIKKANLIIATGGAGTTFEVLRANKKLISIENPNVTEIVGIYNAALPTAFVLISIMVVFNFVFLPMASELFSQRKIKELGSLYKTVTRWLFIITFPLFLLMLFFPSQIINILFGSTYTSGAIALSILSVGVLINVSTGSVAQTLLAIGKSKLFMWISSIAVLFNVGLNFLLIPMYGMVGAAITTSITMAAINLGFLYFVTKEIKVFPYNLQYLKYIFAALIPSVLIYFIFKKFLFSSPIVLILLFAVYALFYLALVVFMRGITKEDVIILKAVESKTGIRIKFLRNFVKRFI